MKFNKKNIMLLLIFGLVLLVGGCDDVDNYDVVTCTRTATLSDSNTTADLEYKIYYEGDYVKKTVSVEKITSSDKSILNKYKSSYESVFSKYKNIKYYDNVVKLNKNTVTSTTKIDYTKVDTDKILEIEGDNGNIYTKDGKVKLDTLIKTYKKYGSKCDN